VVEAPGVDVSELSGVPAFAEVAESAEGPAPVADVAAVGRGAAPPERSVGGEPAQAASTEAAAAVARTMRAMSRRGFITPDSRWCSRHQSAIMTVDLCEHTFEHHAERGRGCPRWGTYRGRWLLACPKSGICQPG